MRFKLCQNATNVHNFKLEFKILFNYIGLVFRTLYNYVKKSLRFRENESILSMKMDVSDRNYLKRTINTCLKAKCFDEL